MSEQELFDTVVRGLREQGRRSVSGDGACAYRGISGLKCAAGLVIKDEEYRPEFDDLEDGTSVDDVLAWCEDNFVPAPAALAQHPGLLRRLQGSHDCASRKDLWESLLWASLVAVAADFCLDPSSVYEAPFVWKGGDD